MAHERVGIGEVAAEAGVSRTTVSHVLNDAAGARVAEGTRRRVREAAERLGYAPNRLARGLRLRRSHILGLVGDSIATTPHAGQIIVGAQDAARKRGWTLLLSNTGGDPEAERRDVEVLRQYQVDGLLIATMYHRPVRLPDGVGPLPVVLLDATCDDPAVPAVVPDEFGGGRAAVAELLRAGHRRIGFLQNADDIPATRLRLAGYRAALRDAGIRFDRRLVDADESETSGGHRAAARLLSGPHPPTALFCFNDRMAMGAYRAAAELGLRIPEDLSVVGFDDQAIISEGVHPPLTTVALPHHEMGRWAVEALIELVEDGPPARPGRYPVRLECPLVRRGSVAAPRS